MKIGLNPQKAHLHDMKQLYAKFGEDRSSGLRVLVRKRNGNGRTDGRTDGQTDRRTDEAHFYIPRKLCLAGDNNVS